MAILQIFTNKIISFNNANPCEISRKNLNKMEGKMETNVNIDIFTEEYIDRAESIFLHPSPRYSWNEIVTGVHVKSHKGKIRTLSAVDKNTFRGFYRLDKSQPGAKMVFVNFFVSQRDIILDKLMSVRTRNDLHLLCNKLKEEIHSKLTNCDPDQLNSYNKIRKPVDLYLEHLIGMARELDGARKRLIPLLFLPLDNQNYRL